MNLFVEGLQGSGKSTLVRRLSEKYPEYQVFREGDYSPVELAWCAYVTEQKYEEILSFYGELARVLADKSLHILYLKTEDVAVSINVIRKERSDNQGNEMWFPLMLRYFNESPFAKAHGISGEEEMYAHFRHRQELELRILREIFPGRYTVLESKNYEDSSLSF